MLIRPKLLKDPGSAITHYIAMLLALIAAVPLFYKAALTAQPKEVFALAVFAASMVLLYAASTTYHSLDISPKVNRVLKKVDHMMIYILIAGTYTPVCVITLGDRTGWMLLGLVWGIAAAGILMNAFWINCPKWFSSLVYIAMGWICVLAISKIKAAMPSEAFFWLVMGGVIYTAGGIIYALKLKGWNQRFRSFGSHEIFHVFVMLGSACHYAVMYSIA